MAELNRMVSDTQVGRKQAQINTLVLDIHHENLLDYVHEYFYAIWLSLATVVIRVLLYWIPIRFFD